MIGAPKRSVTRFFIPLVDVMILLFSMFMLMPIVEQAGSGDNDAEGGKSNSELVQDNESLLRELQRRTRELQQLESLNQSQVDVVKLRQELEKLRKEKIKALEQRLAVRSLDIDPKNGDLYYVEMGRPPQRRVVDTPEVARDLIRRDRQEAAPREVYYVFRLPSEDSAYPTQGQMTRYREWFRDVPNGIESPVTAFK